MYKILPQLNFIMFNDTYVSYYSHIGQNSDSRWLNSLLKVLEA